MLDKLLKIDKKRFWHNYLKILKTYIILGLPIGSIIFFALSKITQQELLDIFGDRLIFIVAIITMILLTTIRLSLLLEKKKFLKKIKFLKGLDKYIPPIVGSRKKLKEEYISYLFDLFFTAFISFVVIVLFKVIFLPSQTEVSITGFKGTIETILISIGSFFLAGWLDVLIILSIILFGEILLYLCGTYKEFEI